MWLPIVKVDWLEEIISRVSLRTSPAVVNLGN